MKTLHLLITLSLAGTLAGCGVLPKPRYQPTETYMITLQHSVEAVAPAAPTATLGVRRFSAPGRYGNPLVYFATPHKARQLEYDQWLEPPHIMLTEAFLSGLTSSEAFGAVVPLAVLSRAQYVLDGEIVRFDEWDVQGEHVALCEVRLYLLSSHSDTVLWHGTVRGEAPVEGNSTAAVVRAMDHAVQLAVEQGVEAIAGAVRKKS